MKNALNNIAIKISAIVLSFFIFFTMALSVFGIFVMLVNDFYTSDFIGCESSIMGNLAKQELYNLETIYQDSPADYYADKNVYYEVENLTTGDIITNYNYDDYIAKATKTVTQRYYVNYYGELRGDNGVEYHNSYTDDGEYYIYDKETGEELTEVDGKDEIKLTVYIPQKMKYTDRFWLVDKLITFGYNNRFVLIFTAIASFALSIVVYSYIFISAGHHKGSNEISVNIINNIPADILTVITVFAGIICLELLGNIRTLASYIVFGIIILAFMYFLLLWYILSIVVQTKAKSIVKHSVLYKLFGYLAKFGGIVKHIYKNFATVYKVAIVIGAILIIELILIVNMYETDNFAVLWMLISVVISVFLLLAAIAFQKVKKGGEKIVNGDLENKIDTKYMYGDIKDFAESLNNINQGLQVAINDKVKSERFKTELITNVSHDIKTPLTSIVNYVDLIKKEECDNENINQYINVLDRQSKRLKKLIEDLVEASKASTGNLSVELTKCNLSLLINQAIGEYAERFELKNLQFVQAIENQEIYVLADGRRLWRVFDNLLNNICKYAMPGTRVFIELKCDNGKAVITFKNISEMPLTVSGDELTERFVRGDRSRNTEGSGLGLSIAKSLTELQNGSFEIDIDGDLFKAIITFKTIGE